VERTAPGTYKIAVLSSGISRGSNLAALHSYFQEHRLPVEIALAVFTRKDSPAFMMAAGRGIPALVIPAKDMQSFERQVLQQVHAHEVSLIALAGFMKLLSPDFISQAGIPILNIHPALLPKYGGKGMHGRAVQEAVFQAGERFSGATVHLVDPIFDHGTILAQRSVEISDCVSPEAIAQKVLQIEHELFAPTIYNYLIKH